MYPTKNLCFGTFVRDQVKSMEKRGFTIDKVVKRSRNPLQYFPFIYKSIKKLIIGDYDIIHAHYVPHAALVPAILKRNKPFIVRFHGDDARIFPFKSKLNKMLVEFVINRSDRIITVSREMSDVLVYKLGADRNKISEIASGINTSKFHPMPKDEMRKKLGLPEDQKIVLFVGRLHRYKGLDLIYECAKQTPGIQYILIGRKENADVFELENCMFVGEKNRDEIPMWLNAADIHILPSYTEGLPNAVVEALSCGTPSIVSDAGGNPEAVIDGDNGFVVSVGDAEMLREKIEYLINDDELIEKMGKRGREYVVERFEHERLMDRLKEIYDSMSNKS